MRMLHAGRRTSVTPGAARHWLRRWNLLLGAVLLSHIAAQGAHAADGYPVLVYPCYRVEGTVRLDGRMDEPAWRKAPAVSGFIYYNRPETASVQTTFRALHDDQGLLVGVQCDEPEWQKLTMGARAAHDTHAAVFTGEAVEVFLDPSHDHTHYVQIAVGLSGTLYDTRGSDVSWNSGAEAATGISEGQWCVEMRVPWIEVGVRKPATGMVLGFNVCRDREAGERQWTTWSRVEANFHDPVHFGHLVLAPTPEMIAGLSGEFRKGGMVGPIRIFGTEGFSGTTYLALAEVSLRSLEATLSELEGVARREPGEVAAALRKRIGEARAAVAPYAAKVRAREPLEAPEWVQVDALVQKLRQELGQALWEARLESLLRRL